MGSKKRASKGGVEGVAGGGGEGKRSLNLSVSAECHRRLTGFAYLTGRSRSELVESWVTEKVRGLTFGLRQPSVGVREGEAAGEGMPVGKNVPNIRLLRDRDGGGPAADSVRPDVLDPGCMSA